MSAVVLEPATLEAKRSQYTKSIYQAIRIDDSAHLAACVCSYAACERSLNAFKTINEEKGEILPKEIMQLIRIEAFGSDTATRYTEYDKYRRCALEQCRPADHTSAQLENLKRLKANINQMHWPEGSSGIKNAVLKEQTRFRKKEHVSNVKAWAAIIMGHNPEVSRAVDFLDASKGVKAKFTWESFVDDPSTNVKSTKNSAGYLGIRKIPTHRQESIDLLNSPESKDLEVLSVLMLDLGINISPRLRPSQWLLIPAEEYMKQNRRSKGPQEDGESLSLPLHFSRLC